MSLVKKIGLLYIALLTTIGSITTNTFAYWATGINNLNNYQQIVLQIGEWSGSIVPDAWNLNIWENENTLNQTVPINQLFSYDGFLYIGATKKGYTPIWHGLPANGSNQWAYFAIELEWRPNVNYRTNSVVLRDGRYFIANYRNNRDWFINDPLTHSGHTWSEWREIEPISINNFGILDDYGIPDFSNPDWNYIIYI